MSAEKDFTQGTKKKGLLRTLGFVFIALLALLITLVAALQSHKVQTWLAGELTEYLQQKIDFPITIERAEIHWLDALQLRGVEVYDQQDSLMIAVDRLAVDFNLSELLNRQHPSVDEVILYSPRVQLLKNTADSGLNMNLFIQNIRSLLPQRKAGKKEYIPFVIQALEIRSGHFLYHDPHKDSLQEIFDYNHFALSEIEASTRNFRVVADTLDLQIDFLTARAARYDFTIDTLQTQYRYNEEGMDFRNLHLRAGRSVLRDSVSFRFRSPETLSYFVDSVQIGAQLNQSRIHSRELAVFAPFFEPLHEGYRISGNFEGSVSNFRVRKMDIRFGRDSQLLGSLHMDGLPDFQETFIDADLTHSRIRPGDLAPYVDERSLETVQRLGIIDFNTSFIGFPQDFVARGRFLTELGVIDSDINLKLADKPQNSTYSGSLALDNFDLGKLLGTQSLQKIGLRSELKGKGLSLQSAQLELSAEAAFLGYKGYQYQNIVANGKLAREFFAGQLRIDDPNLQVQGEASLDFRNRRNLIKVDAMLDTAIFQALQLSEKPFNLHSRIQMDLSGLTLDSLRGTANLANVEIYYDGRSLALDTLALHSSLQGQERNLDLKTDKFQLNAKGNFTFGQTLRDFRRLLTEYELNFRNQRQEIARYYAQKPNIAQEDYDKYRIDFSLKMEEPDPIVKLLEPELHLSDSLFLEGSFTAGYTSILSAYARVDTLQYGPNYLYGVEVDLNSSKIADSTNVLAMAFVQSKAQELEGIAPTERLLFEGIWLEDHIDLSGQIYQQNKDNFLDLAADVYFLTDSTLFQFAPSTLRILDNSWRFSEDNRLLITRNGFHFQDFRLFNGPQTFVAEGTLSDDTSKSLNVRMENVALNNLNPISPYTLEGTAGGALSIRRSKKANIISGFLNMQAVALDGFPVGDLETKMKWLPASERIQIDLLTRLEGNTVLSAKGTYAPFVEEDQLALDATFNRTQLNLLEPVLGSYFTDIGGWISGQAVITGTPRYPILRGGGRISEGKIRIDYTNTRYKFDGNFVLLENEIGFRELEIRDQENNPAYLNGGVFHDGFRNFVIDIRTRLLGTQVLNTTYTENSLYYGVAYASGNLDILGPVNNLLFSSEARTDKGTKIYIPISDEVDLSEQDYIHFVSARDTSAATSPQSPNLNLSGIKLDFDIDVTQDAYVEVIFDLRAGDIIRGRGQGKLEMNIDTRGEFTMFGTYQITEGAYNFTLFNVITKEFLIDPGSTIRWSGDPYGGELGIKASYVQYASLEPLFAGSVADPQASRAYPIILGMDLTGNLLSPDITFDIDFRDYPQAYYNELQSFRRSLQANEQYLNRQVFNLIVLRQFRPEEQFNPDVGTLGSQTAISSISELLSNQFSMLASQIDENLEIDLDVSSSVAAEAINTFQLRLSYTFLNGRLRVTRDGSLTTQANASTTNNLLGNWTVEYLLTTDGQYRVKMYSRNNQSRISAEILPEFQQGFSLSQSKSFDTFKELFQRNQRSRPQPTTPVNPPDSELGPLLREEEIE